jgi:hypothetical protein
MLADSFAKELRRPLEAGSFHHQTPFSLTAKSRLAILRGLFMINA